MKAKGYQNKTCRLLKKQFKEVEKEWSISKGASDKFTHHRKTYAPRLDIAVGPFNITPNDIYDNQSRIEQASRNKFIRKFISKHNISSNINPRCLLAVEIVFNGSSKHILGDITNASMMGYYGIVVANDKMLDKVKRVYSYIQKIKKVGKAPSNLFNNIIIISSNDFLKLI
jgi:hypothetical protein